MKRFLFAFKLYYLVYILLAFNAFINETTVMGWATDFLAVFGGAAAACMLIRFRDYIKVWNIWLIAAFLASYVLSSLLNYRYGVAENIKELIWLVLSMAVLYASCAICSAEEMKKEFFAVSAIWTVYCVIVNFISITMVVWGREYGVYVVREGQNVGFKTVGFKWGRLWGMYDDPNHGAAIAIAALLLSFYLFLAVKRKVVKALLILSMIVQFLYIVLSDSRTGTVMLAAAGFLWTAALVYRRERKKGSSTVKTLTVCCCFGVLAAAILAGGSYGCKQEYNLIDSKIEAMLPKKPAVDQGKNTNTNANATKDKNLSGQVGRKQDLVQDASNGRFSIWKSGFEIAEASPVYGVSFRNMTAYAEKNLPDTYLVNNPEKAKYDSLHNSVMDILVSQGMIGIAIFLAIVVNTGRLMKKKISSVRAEEQDFAAACFITAAVMGAGSLFLSMVFYLNAPQTYIFWLCFGYFMETLRRGEVSR